MLVLKNSYSLVVLKTRNAEQDHAWSPFLRLSQKVGLLIVSTHDGP
jgi:hypothetical protein